ncbi:hypothetical protein BSL82_05645 [Tardibacter chloracetimidivorans]|uniref:DUF6950 domain-containing protein n=1 Tax=Tardibacter chloracetimidivorans TaxID=1921510 RepID=A0A1L3ZT87_9SPHN|nr:hypothetical protein [Tardibacter chloracetimidivorans]API58856.1 hypothetical protein BSL82_05645 [Tardibacter chloracetimidivorans]
MRVIGWEKRLQQVLDAWGDREHGWQATCGDFAAEVVEAVAGRDVRPLIGLPVRSAREVAELYRHAGVRSLAGAVTKVLGEPRSRLMARRGDIVEADGDMALGVCLGERAAFLLDRGLVFLPMSAAVRSWSVE